MRPRAAIGLVLALLVLVPSVGAHANYYRSEPARGARLAEAPAAVSVTLSEPVDPRGSSLEVRDQSGARVDLGGARFQGGATPTLTVDLRSDLPPGAYQATWIALSTVDGHVTDGTFGFAVGGFEPPSDAAENDDTDVLSATSRALAYAGYALAFGVLAFALYIDRAPANAGMDRVRRRLLGLGTGLILVGTLGLFFLTVQDARLGVEGFLRTQVGRQFGLRILAATLTFIVGLAAWRRGLHRGVLAGLLVLLLVDVAGNSQFVHSAQRGWWAAAIDFAHLVSVSVWLGGLALLLHFILHASGRGSHEDVIRVGRRFSGVALTSVFVLGLTGLASTVLILGLHPLRAPWAVWSHPYGSYLGGKVLLFGLMLGLAALNRFIFLGSQPGPDMAPLPRIYASLRPDRSNRGDAFARAVGLEATLGVVVLVLAGFLTATSPPSAEAQTDAGYARLGFSDHYNVTLRMDPPPAAGGVSNLTLDIENAGNGTPLADAIRITVTLVAAGGNETGGEMYPARRVEAGRWLVGEILLTRAGEHQARIEIQTEDVYRETITVSFTVAA